MIHRKLSKIDIGSIVCILIFSIIIWFPTRLLPFHWDSAAFVQNAAKNLYDTNFSPLIAVGSEFAHPPLYPFLLAFIGKIFNCNPSSVICNLTIAHLTILPFFILLLISTYFLGKKVHSPTVGIVATTLVGLTPFVLAELGMPYIDLSAGALAATSLTLWLYQKPKRSVLFLSLAVLTKFTVIILLIPIFIDLLQTRSRSKDQKSYILSLTSFLVPLTFIFLWLLYHHAVTGWWLTIPGRDTILKISPQSLFNSIKFVFYVFFIRQGRWLLTVISTVSLIKLYQTRRQLFSPNQKVLLYALCSTLLAFSITGEFIPRYAIAILPAFYVISTSLMYQAISKPFSHPVLSLSKDLAILAILFLFITSLHPKITEPNAFQFRINEDLSYQDHIAIGQQLSKYLETSYSKNTIYGSFPQRYQFTQPWQGYVTQPLNFYECDHYALSPMPYALIVIHPYHYSQLDCQEILSSTPHTLVKEFTQNQIWAQVYQLN
jgi:hypothetical protein